MAQVYKDGIYIEPVFSALYLDYGLSMFIRLDSSDTEYSVFYSPHCLSSDSYGLKVPEGSDMDYEEAECLELLVPWDDKDWQEMLEAEADTLIEAYLGMTPADIIDRYHTERGQHYNWEAFIESVRDSGECYSHDMLDMLRASDPRYWSLHHYLTSEGWEVSQLPTDLKDEPGLTYRRGGYGPLDYIVVRKTRVYLSHVWIDRYPDPIMIQLIRDVLDAFATAEELGKKPR